MYLNEYSNSKWCEIFAEIDGDAAVIVNAFGVCDSDDIAERQEEGDDWKETIYYMAYSSDDFGGFDADIFSEKAKCISHTML